MGSNDEEVEETDYYYSCVGIRIVVGSWGKECMEVEGEEVESGEF
jgi:hypothetical protein